MFPISFYIGLILIGIFAGFASGLLGVGGGFLMVPLQFFLFSSVGVDPSLAMMVCCSFKNLADYLCMPTLYCSVGYAIWLSN